MRAFQIIKREVVTALARIGLRKVRSDYLGMKLIVPVVHGRVNDGFLLPAESWMSDCLRAFVETRSGCVFDAGSSFGVYLVKLRAISSDVPYYGVEPTPYSNLYTRELIRLNGFRDARVLPFALSDEEGLGMIYTGTLGSKSASAIPSHDPDELPAHSFEAWFTTGDRIVETLGIEEMAALKLDVEGMELEALKGLEETVRRLRPHIYCEILHTSGDPEPTARAHELFQLVRGMDYEVLGVAEEDRTLQRLTRKEQVEAGFWQEYIFTPPEHLGAFLGAIEKNVTGVRLSQDLRSM